MYKDKIWCDVMPINVEHMILGRSQLFDMNATLYGRTNTCVFKFEGEKIKLTTLFLKAHSGGKSQVDKGKDVKGPQTKTLNILSPKEFEQEVQGDAPIHALVARLLTLNPISDLPVEVKPLIREFEEMFTDDLKNKLPSIHDIQHAIDLVLGATLPNLHHYMMNPTNHVELKRQMDELLKK